MTVMSMWTVYDHPTDYPDNVVARLWIIEKGGERPTNVVILAPDLDSLREALLADMYLTKIMRSPSDDPKIVETWL